MYNIKSKYGFFSVFPSLFFLCIYFFFKHQIQIKQNTVCTTCKYDIRKSKSWANKLKQYKCGFFKVLNLDIVHEKTHMFRF